MILVTYCSSEIITVAILNFFYHRPLYCTTLNAAEKGSWWALVTIIINHYWEVSKSVICEQLFRLVCSSHVVIDDVHLCPVWLPSRENNIHKHLLNLKLRTILYYLQSYWLISTSMVNTISNLIQLNSGSCQEYSHFASRNKIEAFIPDYSSIIARHARGLWRYYGNIVT